MGVGVEELGPNFCPLRIREPVLFVETVEKFVR